MKRIATMGAVAIAAALCFNTIAPSSSAWAQMETSVIQRRARMPKDLSPEMRESLEDQAGQDAGPYLDKENEKKASGQVYTDLQQKFEYLPTRGLGSTTVSVKLGGAEYDPKNKASSKGAATGKLKYLVFTYEREGSKWVPVGKPKWEVQDLGKLAGKEMTSHISNADQRKQAYQAAQQKKKSSLAAALKQKFGQ